MSTIQESVVTKILSRSLKCGLNLSATVDAKSLHHGGLEF